MQVKEGETSYTILSSEKKKYITLLVLNTKKSLEFSRRLYDN